jgi:hypothetical protein
MKSYNERLPKFTAQESLLNYKNAKNSLTYSSDDYYYARNANILNMAQRPGDPTTWCKNTCDPETGEGENCRWRTDIQDCVCIPCRPPPTRLNCCGKPRGSPCP